MLSAFTLALGQLSDPRVLRVLAKSLAITLALFAVIGTVSWWLLDGLLQRAGADQWLGGDAEGLRGLAALLLVLIGGWLLWRILALAVLQFHADEIVVAVEARHYPAHLADARALEMREEIRLGLRGAARALGYNLLALPFALLLLVTGIGPAIVFWAVNAVLLGRELTEMVWLRHRHRLGEVQPLGSAARIALGGIVAALFIVPFVNLLAPVLGAAMATHLIHRKETRPDAP